MASVPEFHPQLKNALNHLPDQLEEALEFEPAVDLDINPENIIFCAMGGSALAGNFLDIYLNDLIDLPVFVHRDYGLPKETTPKSLVIANSYSGNTEEAVDALLKAQERGLTAIATASGGTLAKAAREQDLPLVEFSDIGMEPRYATPYMFIILLKTLACSGIIGRQDGLIMETAKKLRERTKELEVEGKELARKIKDRIPIIYAPSEKLKALAYVWKVKFNETSKSMAWTNFFPEINHNEMIGYDKLGKYHFVLIHDPLGDPRNAKRLDLTRKIIQAKQGYFSQIDIGQEDILTKLLENTNRADWCSYYLARQRRVNPLACKILDDFKAKMKE